MEKGNDLTSVFSRISQVDKILNENLTFATHDKYGYLTVAPNEIGNTLRISMQVKLPQIMKKGDLFVPMCSKYNLSISPVKEGGTRAHQHIFDVSNKAMLGVPVADILTSFMTGVKELVEQEFELEK